MPVLESSAMELTLNSLYHPESVRIKIKAHIIDEVQPDHSPGVLPGLLKQLFLRDIELADPNLECPLIVDFLLAFRHGCLHSDYPSQQDSSRRPRHSSN